MEEKNLASEMLSQIKKYVGTDTPESASAKAEATSAAQSVSEDKYLPKEPWTEKKPKVRQIPTDESLFEFESFVDEPAAPEPSELTEAEAVYVEELREKFGISKSVGVGFISDDDMEGDDEPLSKVAPVVEEITETPVVEEITETPVVEEITETPAIEEITETPAIEEITEAPIVEGITEAPAIEEITEAPIVEEITETPAIEEITEAPVVEEITEAPVVEEITEAPVDKETVYEKEPEQVTFAVPELSNETVIRESKPMPDHTPMGVQLTFLDTPQEPENEFDGAEQLEFNTGAFEEDDDFDYDEEDDGFDDDDDYDYDEEAEDFDGYEDLEQADEEYNELSDAPLTEVGDISEAAKVTDAVSDGEIEAEKDGASDTFFGEDATSAPTPDVSADSFETATLTPIEISAMEEEERIRAEQESAEEPVFEETEQDIWDASDKKLWISKKRYMEYCDGLTVPPLKITKEEKDVTRADKKIESSGYVYEMTERAPIFADGIGEGRNTDSYFKREVEYCDNREAERGAYFRDKLRVSWKKTVFSLVIMLSVVLIESIAGIFKASISNPMPFAIALLVLLGVEAGLVFNALKDGIRLAVKGVFLPEFLTAGVVIPTIVYHLVLVFAGGSSKYAMLFGTSAAIAMFLTALYRYNMLKREHIVFTVTSSYGDYVTEVKMKDFKNSPEGIAFDGYVDPESSLYKMNRVGRIDAAYTDKPVRDECYGIIRVLFLCIICAAVVAGVVFGIIRRDLFYGAVSAISLISFSAPVSVFVALFLPRVRGAAVSAKIGGAVVDFDDESDQFDRNVIMIDDKDLFPIKNIPTPIFEMRHMPGLEESLSRTAALFKKIGGPLKALEMEGGYHDADSVSITDISENGISAVIDGRNICAGSDSYMRKRGIKFKRYGKLLPKNSRVMYIADGGVFFAMAVITFVPDQTLVRRIAELRNTETVFSLKTCNPCIDTELLFDTTGLEPDLLRLVKYAPGDDVAPAATDREGSLVSSNGTVGLITALLEYKRQKKLVFEASRFACVAFGVGAFVSLMLSGVGLEFGFASLISLAVHGGLSLAAFFMATRNAINTKSKIKKQ
ncbi:MAG: hypothetical protein IKB51_01490 [Clostridia bacterium]|nr:hypothetical protein [Clostridia bacterium]